MRIALSRRPRVTQQNDSLLAPAIGDSIEAVGHVIKSGRTLTIFQLEVHAVHGADR